MSSGKRKKGEDDATNITSSKKQRTRCVARKVPDLCKAYTPGKADQDLNARISRLEQIIEVALPQYCSPGTPGSYVLDQNSFNGRHRTPSNGEDDTRSHSEEQDPSGGIFQSGRWYGNSASGSVAPASVIDQIENAAIGERESSRTSHSNAINPNFPLPTTHIKAGLDVVGDDSEPSAADNLKSLVQECGVSPHKIAELLQELPIPSTSDILVDFYFSTINWTRYPISVEDFRTAYSSISACVSGTSLASPHDVRFLPLLFVVLAISVRLAPESIAGDARTRRVTSLRYYWSSRRSLLIAAAIQPDSLDIVLTRLLSARFLTFDRRITECWSQLGAAVRTAQALGLHRDGSAMGMQPTQTEYRRRIWSYLYHADRSYALVLGRPNSIQDDYTSTLPPSNIDGDLQHGQTIESLPLSRPTPMTFVILRHQLAEIIGRMVHHFQQVRDKSHYTEVVALDDELLKFINNLPSHYSLQPDTSLDHIHNYIPVHRFLLVTEILFVRISLHRPYMLRRLNSDRYARSRNACFESAITDFKVRQAFRESVPKETRDSLSNAYREFQTAMISGIYFVLEPHGAHSDAMHAILDGFMKDHENLREMDETTKRELKTIEFLKSKASQIENHGVHSRKKSKLHDLSLINRQDHQAQLLLNLQQPVTSPSTKSFTFSASSPRSPSLPQPNTSSLAQSPTLHRLQHPDQTHSPTTSGSPRADDESPAQSLLDTWCHTVSNAPLDLTSGGISWGGLGGTEISGWAGITHAATNPDPRLFSGLDGSDFSYWEALVNQIHRGP
ncbi:putative transcriptional regulatory protein C1F7.11c [Psilocybe cubensis]|uniref:Transcriptional regulatory protein C1F7.11c n=1 Tax=Psilocybe cubensis TaxID=181762 RepID=A0ACB8H689_PSICU|nr:putative transcriptional regulatory protein C1F7.11c [Psilocybe cubensis]KAH9482704.1 putative transcriptional regulatory protein C1F7.11c [Psilocybe cubensis]